MTSLADKLQNLELCLKNRHDQEVSYGRALRKAIVCTDLFIEVEVLKSLGDLHLQKGKLGKDSGEIDKAAALYAAALLRCKDPDMGQTLEHRIDYMEKLSKQLLQGYTPHYRWLSSDYWGTADSNVLRVVETCDKLDRSNNKSQDSVEEIYTETLVTAIENSDMFLELEVLKSLGDFYLEKGKETSDETQFSNAAAMYKKALTRCEDPETKQTLHHRICYTEKIREAVKMKPPSKESRPGERDSPMGHQFGNITRPQDHPPPPDIPRMATGEGKVSNASTATLENDDSTYQDHIQDGCRALQTGDLDGAEQSFAAALKSVHVKGQHREEAEPLYRLGDVYLKRGIQSKDGGDFTKASALCNAALELNNGGVVSNENAHHLMVLVSISAELRLRTYMGNGGQVENIKAINYYEQSLQMMQSIYGVDTVHPHIASSLNNLGAVWSDLGDYRKAINYYQQSLKMNQGIYGEDTVHPEIASYLNNLGVLWGKLGDCRKAVSYYKQSLQMRRRIYGENTAHPDIADTLNNLGVAWVMLGDYKNAISHYEESLQMKRSIYGEGTAHTDIAFLLNNFGTAWRSLADYRKAISYYEQSLEMKRSIYGENTAHPDITTSLNNLGNVYTDLGDHRKAISYYEQSLQMRKNIYCTDIAHPDIADSLNNLGNASSNLGDHRKAVSYHEQSLQMKQRIYGDDTSHPDIAASLINLGNAWSNLGDCRKAVKYYGPSLEMYRVIYGEDTAHPDIASLLNNMGVAWLKLGDPRKAVNYHEQSLHMRRNVYGEDTAHPDIVASLINLGIAWGKLRDYSKAVSYYQQSLKMRRSIHGENTAHPDMEALISTTAILNNLGRARSDLGDNRKATCLIS
ncbi:TTC28 [Branchiostoma lanceolatum]|uniref:TTC28 protein n=1 Tax=Branchiostoma lanceolatum TaxID=7740 RepID=A0A8J9VS57_BRALA|nr:TTC28 [Branchiostoma lanceolatum]